MSPTAQAPARRCRQDGEYRSSFDAFPLSCDCADGLWPSLARMMEEDILQCKMKCGAVVPTSGQTEQNQRDRSGHGLYKENFPADGDAAIGPGNDDAKQEKHLDLESEAGCSLHQPPDQARGE